MEITIKDNIDIFYVDICLNNSSGLDFAKEVRQIAKYEYTLIIFLTTHVEYITQAFKEVHCYDFILKQYNMSDVVNITKRFKLHIENINDMTEDKKYVVIKVRKGVNVKIYIDDTIFIEVNLRVCIIHTVNGIYQVNNLGLKEIINLIILRVSK